MAGQQSREGLRHMAKAIQHTHVGLLRWKPDYGKAASEYAQAALAFCRAKRVEKATEAFLKEAESHEKNQVPLRAAMAYEQAGLYLSTSDHVEDAAEAVKQAISWYLECGEVDIAAWTLRRFSHLLESHIPHHVVYLYQQASQLLEGDDRFLLALDFTGRASKVLVRHKNYRDAAMSLGQEKHLCMKVACSSSGRQRALLECVAHLCDLDFPAASKCLKETCVCFPTFPFSGEYGLLVTLMSCYQDRDQDAVDLICGCPLFRHLDNEYRKMMKMLKVPDVEDL